jgi:stage V sporulation protein B
LDKKSISRQSVITGLSHAISIIAALLVQIITSRVFGPEGRGVFANIFALSGFLALALGTGHEVSNAFFVASGVQKPSNAFGGSVIGLLLSSMLLAVVTSGIIYFKPSFVLSVDSSLIFLAILTVPLSWLTTSLCGILRGTGRADLSYWYYGISNLVWFLSVVFLCITLSYRELESVFIARLLCELLAFAMVLWFLRKAISWKWLKPDLKAFKQSIIYSLKFYFARIANPMLIHIELVIIPIVYMDKIQLGIYAQAFAILAQMMVVSCVVGYVLMPQVAQNIATSAALTARACRIVLWLTIGIGVLIMLLSKPVILLLFGKAFLPCLPLMWIMFPGLVLRSIPRILYHHFQGIGKPMTVSIVFFISMVVMLTIDLLLIPIIGINGAAIGILCSCLLEFWVFSYLFIRLSKVKFSELLLIQFEDLQLLASKIPLFQLQKSSTK